MKKYNDIFRIVAALLTLTLLAGCNSEPVTYDHELPQFDTRDNAVLIELIAPSGTSVDDEIYIFGAFNGENEKTVTDKLEWKMEKAQYSDKKWGIYLFPDRFVSGKTLADGFSFVSVKAGGERDIQGQPVTHTLDASVGTRYNVWAERWAAYFSGEGQTVTHDGFVIYVLDESPFASLTLYMYGDVNDLNGTWPGMKPTGLENINGVEYTYFDMGSDNNGLTETLIFSDNGATQLGDYGPVTFAGDNIFLHISEEGSIDKIDPTGTVGHDGPVAYVLDGKNWGFNTTLYMWGDVNNLNGAWPGMSVGGTATFGQYTYLYFDLGAANVGLNESLIFSNNGATQLGDYPGNDQMMTISEDIFFYIGPDGVQRIEDPENPGDLEWFNPVATPKEEALIDLYFYNGTDTLVISNLYAWGTSEIFGAWPGKAFSDMDTTDLLGLTLLHTTVNAFVGDAYHLIVNGKDTVGNDLQLKDYDLDVDQTALQQYLKITDAGVAPLQISALSRQH